MTALFAQCHGLPLKAALKTLGATQRSALSLGRDWAKANTQVSKTLGLSPSRLLSEPFQLEAPKPGLLSFFDRRPKDDTDLEAALLLAEPTADLGPAPSRRTVASTGARSDKSRVDDDLRSLVDSSLAELRGE
jgi:hypothetical protein